MLSRNFWRDLPRSKILTYQGFWNKKKNNNNIYKARCNYLIATTISTKILINY